MEAEKIVRLIVRIGHSQVKQSEKNETNSSKSSRKRTRVDSP